MVTIRLARAPDLPSLLSLLGRIDATRAPLHPTLLRAWVGVFGPSEASSRSFSALCGVATVAFIYMIGREVAGRRAGLWSAWLSAISPPLVQYSRETRMYALLAMLTCAAWWRLLRFRRGASAGGQWVLGALLAAIGYTHPLGPPMIAVLGLGYLIDRKNSQLSFGRWGAIQVLVGFALWPWLGHYLDHPPESTVGVLPIRFLLGLPIGYVGGNFAALGVCGLVAAWGMRGSDRRTSMILLSWLTVVPTSLYLYSRLGHPIFGPARYTLFVGPAYLLVLGVGLARLPGWARWPLAVAGASLAWPLLATTCYAPGLKADWRLLSRALRGEARVIRLARPDPSNDAELETARYYLPPAVAVRVAAEAEAGRVEPLGDGEWLVVCGRDGPRPAARYDGGSAVERVDLTFPGLRCTLYARIGTPPIAGP